MFYEASQIDNLIICKICDQKLEDPRLLPCGKSVCNKCIESMTDTEKRRVKCQNCAKTHDIPQSGFVPNLEIAKIINLESNQVFRNEIVEEFKNVSDLIRQKSEKIYFDLSSSETKINDRCNEIRNEVRLAIEEAHLVIDKIHNKFLNTIQNYQKECRQSLNIKQNGENLETILDKANKFKINKDDLLKQFQIEETDIKTGLAKAKNLLTRLEKFEDKFKLKIFNDTSLKFEKTSIDINESMIGMFKKLNSEMHFLKDIHNRKEIDLTEKFNHSFPYPYTMVYPFSVYNEQSSFLIVRNFHDKTIFFSVIDHEGNLLVENKISFYNTLVFIRVTPLIKNNFFCVCTIEEQQYSLNRFVRIQSFDKDLNLISKKYLDSSVRFILATSENLFMGFFNENGYISLGLYNQRIEAIKVYGQNNKEIPFYLPNSILKFLIAKKCFITQEPLKGSNYKCRITVIRQKDGTVKSTFCVKLFDSWTLYLDKFILLFKFDENTITCYDFNGILKMNKTKFSFDLTKFKFNLNNKLYFLEQEKEKLKLISF